jgi:ribosomal protein S27AE
MVERALGTAIRVVLLTAKLAVIMPFFAVRAVRRLTSVARGAVLLLGQDDISCDHCGAALVLTARWRCARCGYVWLGFGFSRCPMCGEPCRFLNCQSCGTSIRNPLP